ncbi:oxidoreductase, 2-nitropropane dioxygenase family [Coprobacillus sp. 8_1_38FAA]|nr:oxidoreductase, 2-nitropropane dioxygenase family [Coprobacillus sp. 8_1_38FAA]
MLEINHKKMNIPLIQGGMGVGVSLGNLAGHVAKCEAMGVISTAHPGYREEDFESNHREANIRALKKEIKKAQEISKGKGLVAINAMVAIKDYDELIEAALSEKIDAIISGAGLPLRLPELVKDHEVLIAPIVSSGKACKLIMKHWLKKYQRTPDFIVIEGALAGGHLGFKKEDLENQTYQSLEEIFQEVEQVVESFQLNIPVFVAGGIHQRSDVKHFFELGVDGIQVASRFIPTYECDASMKYKEAFLKAKKEEVGLVSSPVGMPGRAFQNAFVQKTKKKKYPSRNVINV